MADRRINQLPGISATDMGDSDCLPIFDIQTGTTYQVTTQVLREHMESKLELPSTAIKANSQAILLNSQTAIFGGAGEAIADPTGQNPGWYYRNATGEKINWYFYGDTAYVDRELSALDGCYMIVEKRASTSYLYFTIYTKYDPLKPSNVSWYRSRINYLDEAKFQALAPGRYVVHTAGIADLITDIAPDLPRVELDIDLATTVGQQDDDEEVFLIALSSSSNFPEGHTEVVVEEFGYMFDEVSRSASLLALPEPTPVGQPSPPQDAGVTTKFWMKQGTTPSGGTTLVTGGGYTLYSRDTDAGDGSVELSSEEATSAASARVFVDYSGKTLEERADLTEPIVLQDEKVLADVTRLVKGYFHSQDLSILEINDKMTLYGDALQAAACGSVELTMALMASLTVPTSGTAQDFTYQPNGIFNFGSSSSSYENYYNGDPAYDEYGISKIEFNQSFITIHFKDSASMTAWRSQDQTFEIDVPGASYTWEKPLTLNDAAMYGSPSPYNYIHYQDSSQLSTAERAEMAQVSASSGSPFNIELNNAGTSVADALGETDVVNTVIAKLSLHLAKFPR